MNDAFLQYNWDSTEVTEIPSVVRTVRRKVRTVNITLSADLFNWHKMTYESIGREQAKAQEYLRSLQWYTSDEVSSPMEDVVTSEQDDDDANQLDDDA